MPYAPNVTYHEDLQRKGDALRIDPTPIGPPAGFVPVATADSARSVLLWLEMQTVAHLDTYLDTDFDRRV